MENFLGRYKELQALEAQYTSAKSAFVPIYGRRRVGKSELIRHFLQEKPGLFFLGKESTAEFQIKSFLKTAARHFGLDWLNGVAVDSWQSAIELVLQNRPKAEGQKFVLVFDEFQWMAQSSPELPSVLQELWDLQWQHSGEIFLILCGSYMGFMEKAVLGQKSPLFGRRTAQIFLKPFLFEEAQLFHPQWSLTQKAQAYFVCGGIPFYHQLFRAKDSFPQSIQNSFLSEHAVLHREADFLLREELRDLEKYYSILIALASGRTTRPEISKYVGIEEKNLHYYLTQLMALNYVARRFPLSPNKPSAKQVRYVLKDAMLRFWFLYIYPHMDMLQVSEPKEAYLEIIKPDVDRYFGLCFEQLCRERLMQLYREESVSGSVEVGEYWDKSIQVDLVGLRQDDVIDLGECKWGAVPSLPQLVEELREKMRRYPNPRNARLQGRIFTRNRLKNTEKYPEISFHCLEDFKGS